MNMNYNFNAAVFWLIKNQHEEYVMIKRKNTWFLDWYYGLPSWHLNSNETITEWLIREMKEEIGITVTDYELVHTANHFADNWSNYFLFFFLIKNYEWEIVNNEPDKSEWIFYIDTLSSHKIQYGKILTRIYNWRRYSEGITAEQQ